MLEEEKDEQVEIFTEVLNKFRDLIFDSFNSLEKDDDGSFQSKLVDPMLTGMLFALSEAAFSLGYTKGELLERIADSYSDIEHVEMELEVEEDLELPPINNKVTNDKSN